MASANWCRKAKRHAILAMFDGACAYCGAKLVVREGSADGLDHVVARNAGGSNATENLVAACAGCNSSKGDAHLADWLANTPRGQAVLARLAGSLVRVAS